MEVYLKTREEWRKWLEDNYNRSEGIWFTYYKKASGKPSVSYKDAVEEALCYGWIDGKIKRINEDYYIQWFTHRRRGSRVNDAKRLDTRLKRIEKVVERSGKNIKFGIL